MTDAAIRVQDLRFSYGQTEALRGISFEVAPGEILGFLGPNGAGKSTTIKILTGQLPLKTGRAQVLGIDVTADDPVVQSQIGVCFEEKNLYEALSGRENLRFFARLFGIKDLDADALLREVGLAERARDPVGKYSKGMRQRLMMARALVNRPRVLFLDEPTDGLDPASARAIRTLIKEEAERGAAILLTTHDMFEADELSDRVAFINEGRIHAIDTPENLKLQHGRRAVKVRVREGDAVREQSVPLDAADAGEQLGAALRSPGLMTIHTEEATLESIFIEITGRSLEG
jgi:ABC-type multidrug transport system ATPase subunit